jgi:hypothetical protein
MTKALVFLAGLGVGATVTAAAFCTITTRTIEAVLIRMTAEIKERNPRAPVRRLPS